MTNQSWRILGALTVIGICSLSDGRAQTRPEIGAREITFNGRHLSAREQHTLEILESLYRTRLPNGSFWYDSRSGAMGVWGGPTLAVLAAGLELGGPMPANCSGGGTRVFVNGRELHPQEVAVLSQLGSVTPGRYWMDSNGNFGYERGPQLGNLYVLARQRNRSRRGPLFTESEIMGGFSNSAGTCTSSGNCYYPDR